jgi:hypothetical protein
MALGDFRSVYLPYCLKKQKDGSFIVLNREYKPLGFNSRENFIYEDYPISSKIKGITAKTIENIAYDGKIKDGFIFLYNDGCIPTKSKLNMTKYLERLEILAKYKVTK